MWYYHLVRSVTKCTAWHHYQRYVTAPNITISQFPITDADTSDKCNTVVHDNFCRTKCDNNNNWSYPGNGAKYVSKLFVYQSSLCPRCIWKIVNDTIHPEIRWNKDKKNSPSIINNHSLERIGVTVICPIFFIEYYFFIIQIYCSMFRQHTRKIICKGLWTKTQRDTLRDLIEFSERQLLTDNFFKIR